MGRFEGSENCELPEELKQSELPEQLEAKRTARTT
jgi:hypothetical protein